jgi:oligopeptide transport system permease protein
MTSFVLRRVLWTLPVILIVVTTIFFMMRAIGGDPFRHGPLLGLTNTQQGKWTKYGDFQPESISENLHRRYGLDLPWYEQYGNYLQGVAMFDFGPSLSFRNVTVNEILREQAPRSMELGALAFLWAFGLGIPLGVLAALRQGSILDAAIRFFSSLGFAVPSFLVAVLLVYVLSVKLGIFPTNGWSESWRHKVLPSFTLGLVPLALCTRLVRGATIEALQADYVVAARAKGLRRRRVVAAHALRNALIPVITAGGPMLGYLLTGSFVIELIFSVPGIGRYYIASVSARDYNVVLGITVLLALLIILANLVVDVLHALLDPRVREATA